MLFELLVLIMCFPIKGGSLFEELINVDHYSLITIIIMIGKVLKNFGSLTTMRVLSRIFHFALKTFLIRTQLD